MIAARFRRSGLGWIMLAMLILECANAYGANSTLGDSKSSGLAPRAMVLLTGGIGTIQAPTGQSPAVLNSAELFDTVSRTFLPAGNLTAHRDRHAAVVLASGKVLVIGGVNSILVPLILFPGPTMPWLISSTEIFDPATERFLPAATMQFARDEPTATLLPNGKVLVIGGGVAHAELYDPAVEKFSNTVTAPSSRQGQTATLLRDGKVLIAGGGDAEAELFDPVTEKFTPVGYMKTNRVYDTATLLLNGNVLIAGGAAYARGPALLTTEIYDVASGAFIAGPAMTEPRAGHTATLLDDGRVLIAGGNENQLTEIYDPHINCFYPSAMMSESRRGHSATPLPSGNVLIAGGWDESYKPIATAELYDPRTGQFSSPISMMQARSGQTASLVWVNWPAARPSQSEISAVPAKPISSSPTKKTVQPVMPSAS